MRNTHEIALEVFDDIRVKGINELSIEELKKKRRTLEFKMGIEELRNNMSLYSRYIAEYETVCDEIEVNKRLETRPEENFEDEMNRINKEDLI